MHGALLFLLVRALKVQEGEGKGGIRILGD